VTPGGSRTPGGSNRPSRPTRPARPARSRRPERGDGAPLGGSPDLVGAMQPPGRPKEGTLDGLVASKEIVIACGPGGVGKTTTAASTAAMAAYHHGGRVLVLTIDPARRLADALGLSARAGGQGLGNTERRIPDDVFRSATGTSPRGELWAAMLDTKESWDALVRRHAPDARTRDRILANPLYRNIAGRFVQSHDYIAMERLYDLHAQGKYDLVVVDTAPTRSAIDFLDAPARMADFFSSRLLRWLTASYRSRVLNLASRPFYQVADRILGTQFLGDIAEFFILFQSMYSGFVERAEAVTRLLSDRRTTFLVVSTLEATPVREAEYFARALVARKLPLGAIILNKVLPTYFRDRDAATLAERLRDDAGPVAARLSGSLGTDAELTTRVLEEVAESFLNFGVVARREAEQQAELATRPEVLATVPFFDADIVDMEGLLRLGAMMWN
jgi:anion-transporting  ArsA/GET3 family ATPase